MVKRFSWLVFCLLFSVGITAKGGGRQYNSYKGLVMAGSIPLMTAPVAAGIIIMVRRVFVPVPVQLISGRKCRNIKNSIRQSLLLRMANQHQSFLLMTNLQSNFILSG